ncbi:MAG TPA: SCO family protein [Vicinamibacterales bacterium]|nr:SCO family protein [Vicinamibacterales bacterium]
MELTTQDGKVVHFYDDLIKGKIVAIDLIYTTCQYACPLETARLAQVQRLLGDRMGRDVFFYSITIDPEHDTPAVLKEYAEKYNAGPGWLFLTGKAEDIDLISRKTGLYSEPDPNNPDGHTPSLLVGNEATGQWMRNSATDNPKFLSRTIGDWLNSWQTASKTGISFADAPTLNFDRGQYAFNNHCAACHSIGKGDRIGPDLAGVTSTRDRDWLQQFILRPDRMYAEGDPIAVALRAKYKNVRMPNLSLTESDAKALIEYMDREGRAEARQAAPVKASPPNVSTAAILEAYLKIQQALYTDTLKGVAESAATIVAESARIGQSAATMKSAAAAMQTAGDLPAARKGFGALSDAMIAMKKSGSDLDAAKVAYCPMMRKSWVQTAAAIQNPYYGQAMPDCGRFTDAPQK